ncbi:MAG: serine hydrolase [Deltaproteobacteria bacterium]|nr:serine hydrolase [Deltaproteobacteria bacterium]
MLRSKHLLWSLPLGLFLFLLWRADWDVRYLGRVLWHRDSSTRDLAWKDQRTITATHARPWRVAGACPRGIESYLASNHALEFVIIRDGALACEWYGNGGAKDHPAMAFSVSKVVTSFLLTRSQLPLDSSITTYIPELAKRDARFSKITLADLVDMRSGIEFNEDAHFPWVDQDAPRVYYASDLEHTVVTKPVIVTAPGKFTYNDYAPNLNGLAMARGTKHSIVEMTQVLWNELGAESPAAWLVDDHGFAWHESGFVATARDLARIGQFVLDHPDDPWVARSRDPVGRAKVETFAGIDVGYRNAWWTLGDDLVGMGRWGQIMVVDPKTRTVIVRLGLDGGSETNIAIAQRLAALAAE